jgi:hypothetical protein
MSITQPDVELRPVARAGVSRAWQVAIPVMIVAVVLVLVISSDLRAYGGNLTGFIQFGSSFAGATHPPLGALVSSPSGYDGQFFYVQALDPLLLHNATVSALRDAGAGFRMQRVGYPALAFLLAGGQAGAIPSALLALNVLILLAVTAAFAIYASRRGWSTLWALVIALMPGMLMPTLRDLSDPLATASILAGLLLWRSGRRWPAALALTVAVLTREVMMVAVVAVAADAAIRAWKAREVPGELHRVARRVWPVVVLPSAAFFAWQAYITARYGGPVGGADLSLPLVNLVQEVWESIHHGPPLLAAWDLVYVLLIVAATVTALMSLRQRVTIISLGTCALAVGVLVPTLGDVWSDTRLSAPLFALLLVDGLQRRDRRSVLISTAAAAMTILIPFMVPGAF